MSSLDMKLVIDADDHVTIERMQVIHMHESVVLPAILKAIEDALRGTSEPNNASGEGKG